MEGSDTGVIRGPLAAAPLKHEDECASTTVERGHPRPSGCGPIEATSPATTGSRGSVVIRGPLAAAPLKPGEGVRLARPGQDVIRGPLAAAPLKHQVP